MNKQELCKMAFDATKLSYSPYSNCKVGVALLTNNGKVYCGCNIENVSYPASICAEQVAISKAVSEGERDFSAIAIATSGDGIKGKFTPCGICRQVLSEFCDSNMPIYVVYNEKIEEYTLKELLPYAFDNKN